MYIHPVNYFIHCHLTYDSFVFWNLPNSTSELQGLQVFKAPSFFLQVFVSGNRGPAIQPHLQSVPEVANSGWRDYGNKRGLQRLVSMFKHLGIPVTAVINSEAAKDACERSSFSQKLPGFRR